MNTNIEICTCKLMPCCAIRNPFPRTVIQCTFLQLLSVWWNGTSLFTCCPCFICVCIGVFVSGVWGRMRMEGCSGKQHRSESAPDLLGARESDVSRPPPPPSFISLSGCKSDNTTGAPKEPSAACESSLGPWWLMPPRPNCGAVNTNEPF